jgi:hypothetical protein
LFIGAVGKSALNQKEQQIEYVKGI